MQRTFLLQLFAIVAVVLIGAGLDLMEVDATHYASISRDMLVNGDVLQVHYRNADYLDKPPLLFWLSALSFDLFGVHDWSYRAPSILFAFLGLYSTYRFALLYHGKEVARTAVLMFGASIAFFLMCNDVRCDTILTASVITAIWLGCAWLNEARWWQLFGLAGAVSSGMLVKGPIGALAPAFAIGAQLLFGRQWSRLRDPRLLLLPLIVALALLPMCIGLYQQHGWHGVRFYFWEQSFGRITGENRWKDDSSGLFFLHEVLWQTLPWTLFVLLGCWRDVRNVFQRVRLPEYASFFGAATIMVALSFSQFKLPHYLYITLPLFAVLAAKGHHAALSSGWYRGQAALAVLLWCGALALAWVVFPTARLPFVPFVAIVGLLITLLFRRMDLKNASFTASFWVMITVGVVLNGQFYPGLLRYQANAQAGHWAAARGLDDKHFFGFQVAGTALDYYAGHPVAWLSTVSEAKDVIAPGVVIYTDAEHRDGLWRAGLIPQKEDVLTNYTVQMLGIPFLLPDRREAVLERRYILQY
jgi:hypothetical protein